MTKNQNRKCTDCAYCYSTTDGAGFVIYRCKKIPGLVVGESNYLDGSYSSKACEKFEDRRRR